jgi:hypothetical protein
MQEPYINLEVVVFSARHLACIFHCRDSAWRPYLSLQERCLVSPPHCLVSSVRNAISFPNEPHHASPALKSSFEVISKRPRHSDVDGAEGDDPIMT